jgi:hypothetical protein
MANFEMIGGHKIEFTETYFLTYAGGKRELVEKDQKEYNKILHLPYLLQRQELKKIPFEKNPNVIPIKGINLLSFIKELKFVPFFDYYFGQSKLLTINDLVIYEAIKQKNYDIAMRG